MNAPRPTGAYLFVIAMLVAVDAVRRALPDIRTIDLLVLLVAGAVLGATAREVPRLLAAVTSRRLRAELRAASGSVPVDTIIERDGRSYFHMSLDEPGEFRGRFVRFQGPLYSGPVWRLDLASPTWPQ